MAQTNPTDYTYVASGSPDFLVPFPYLSTSEVEVTVDGASTGVIWTAAQSIQLTPTPAVGALVRVRRNTDARDVRNDFSAGAPFSPRNINENNEQLLYVVQEAVNAAQSAVDVAGGIAGTAAGAVATANAADTKAQLASDVANGIAATAAAAIATANAADSKAQLALDTAQSAGVNSFKSRTGAVVPEAGDYTAAQITHNASNVGATLDGLQSALTLLTGTTVAKTSATGAAVIPAGTEAQRPASPVNGQLRYNSEKNQFEGYQNGGWKPLASDSVPMFDTTWCADRANIPAGYVAADGQLLSRATYPDAAAALVAGKMPQAGDATWLANPLERGKYTLGDGSTTFRLPDYNGKFADSLGALFMRGDGARSAGAAGVIQQDAMQPITGQWANDWAGIDSAQPWHGGAITANANDTIAGRSQTSDNRTGVLYSFDSANSPDARTASETRPLNVTGCWVIKLFGAVVNVGSADAAQLASDYANLAGRTSALESIGKPFTKEYTSPELPITFGGTSNLTHLLGGKPKLTEVVGVCKTAQHGFAVGEEAAVFVDANNSSSGVSVIRSETNLRVVTAGSAIFVMNSAGVIVAITPANWRLIVRAWA